jgi:hypothetical protein
VWSEGNGTMADEAVSMHLHILHNWKNYYFTSSHFLAIFLCCCLLSSFDFSAFNWVTD